MGQLGLVLPQAWYHRREALNAFDRELQRSGVPLEARVVLRRRYCAAIPLNPLQYWLTSKGAGLTKQGESWRAEGGDIKLSQP